MTTPEHGPDAGPDPGTNDGADAAPFAARLTRAPRPFDGARADETRALFPDLSSDLADLVAGTGGSSPYLNGLLARERDWIADTLTGPPEAARDALLAETAAIEGDPAVPLRRLKRRLALLVALADLGGVWPLETATGALTRFADAATDTALAHALSRETRRGRLPEHAALSVLAMGKMGAFELNYSSDIDLIVLYDEAGHDPDALLEMRPAFVRATRTMATLLSDVTSEGYVFRTDLRLRPDAGVTPVAVGMAAAEAYYESLGRTWERAAYIKARPAAGDRAAGARFLDRLAPFVWRRHLDYAVVQDAHEMRRRIREAKGLHAGPSHLGHDLKLGQGGIREIEFFTQTRQIIAGGRDASLRVPGTVDGLRALAAAGWVDPADAETLIDDYRAHREVEHRVQMIADRQTHRLPETDEDFARLAALADRDPADYAAEIVARLDRVARTAEDFFTPELTPRAPRRALSPAAEEIVSRWKGYPAIRGRRAAEIFDRVRPALLDRLDRARDADAALGHIDGFLRGLPAGVQLFSLFEANPQLLDLVVDVADTSPALARHLSANPAVFDAVIGGDFFAPWPGEAALRADLSRALAAAEDYERTLDRARGWAREWHFRTGVHHLRGLIDADEAGRQYADLAGAVVAALWPCVVDAFARKHGAPPGRGAAVIGMGSLGARRLNAGSDLDLIVIYDAAGSDGSAGPRSLDPRRYYARLTQALVTALSAPMAEGRLYEVDMRLRPSGRQGPVATSLDAWRAYQTDEAWTWEHLALTRARPVAGAAEVGAEVDAARLALIGGARDRMRTLADVADMRARLAAARPGGAALDARDGAGRLRDIELLGQTAALIAGAGDRDTPVQLTHAGDLGLSPDEIARLTAHHRAFWHLRAANRLVAETPPDGTGAAALLTRAEGVETLQALAERLADRASDAAGLIDRALRPPAPSGGGGPAG